MPAMKAMLLVATLALLLAGCVERTVKITSEPEGALVYLNDEEVGRTPVTVPFTFYGTYDVRLEREGYKPLWTEQRAAAPWWEAPGPDLFAEAVPHNKVELKWHFQMEPQPPANADDVINRARQLRATLEAPATQPGR